MHHNPEDLNLNLQHHKNPKSHIRRSLCLQRHSMVSQVSASLQHKAPKDLSYLSNMK